MIEIAPVDMSTQGAKSTVDTGAALDVVPTPEKEYTTLSTGKFMNRKYLRIGMAIVLLFIANSIVCGLLSLPVIFYNSQHLAEVRPCLNIIAMIIWSQC